MVWVVTTAFVIATLITVKLPHALRDAIAADAIFGALFSCTP
jgi:hypothetical protein